MTVVPDMYTIYQVTMILIVIWIVLVILAIRNRMKYVAKQMGDPMEQGDIWSRRRRKKKKVNSDFEDDSSEESLNTARQERGKRMMEFDKKRKKASSKAMERQDYLIKGKTREELKKIISDHNVGDDGPRGQPDSDLMMLYENNESLSMKMKKKVVVEYDDTTSTKIVDFSNTLSNRLDPRGNILRQRSKHFEVNDKPLSWTV
jgi:hypothetical protein